MITIAPLNLAVIITTQTLITIIEVLCMLETMAWEGVTATRAMTSGPLRGSIEQIKVKHQMAAYGEEKR